MNTTSKFSFKNLNLPQISETKEEVTEEEREEENLDQVFSPRYTPANSSSPPPPPQPNNLKRQESYVSSNKNENFSNSKHVILDLVPEILNNFDNCFSIFSTNEKNANGSSKTKLLWNGVPFSIITPLSACPFGASRHVVKGGKGRNEFSKYTICTITRDPAVSGPIEPDQEFKDPEGIFFLFLQKVDAAILQWGKKNYHEMYSNEAVDQLADSFKTITSMYSMLLRKPKKNDMTDRVIKYHIPTTTKRVKVNVFEYVEGKGAIEKKSFAPEEFLHLTPNCRIKTVVKFTDIWSNMDRWGTSLHVNGDFMFIKAPDKICQFKEFASSNAIRFSENESDENNENNSKKQKKSGGNFTKRVTFNFGE